MRYGKSRAMTYGKCLVKVYKKQLFFIININWRPYGTSSYILEG